MQATNHIEKRDRKLLRAVDRLTIPSVTILILILIYLYFSLPDIITLFFVAFQRDPLPNPLSSNPVYISILSLSQNVIANLIPVGLLFLVSVVIFRVIQDARIAIQNEDLVEKVSESIRSDNEILTSIKEAGILATYKNLDKDLLYREVRRSSEVRILQTWIDNAADFEDTFIQVAQKTNYSIKILLLNPDSLFATRRAHDLGERDQGQGPYLIQQAAQEIDDIRTRNNINIEVRYYDALPSVQLYMCDNHAFVGVFLHRKRSTLAAQLKVEIRQDGNYTNFGKLFVQEFDRLWQSAEVASTRAISIEV